MSATNGKTDSLLDLHAIALVIRRRLTAILAAIAIVLALTALAYALAPRLFTATGRVALERSQGDVVKVGIDQSKATVDSAAVDTEVKVLQSPALAAAVVERLKLDQDATFVGEGTNAAHARRRAINLVASGLDVKREGTSYAIAVSYTSKDPVLATDITNAAINAYVDGQRIAKADDKSSEIRELRQRLGGLQSAVQQAETAVAQYRARTNLVDITKDRTSTQQELSLLNSELASAKAELAAAQARANASRTGTTSAMLQNPVVNNLLTRQAQLQQQRNDLAGRYGERHPALASIDRQLQEIRESIQQETNRVRSSVSADASVAAQRVASIQGSINRAQGALVAGNNASVELAQLERKADSARQTYQAFLDRYSGALATQGTERSNSYVIAEALVPGSPSWPSRPAFLVGGLVASLLVAALVAFFLEMMERGVRSRSELERELGIPALGSIPDIRTIKGEDANGVAVPLHIADYMIANPDSVLTEAFRSLRTTLGIGRSSGPRSLAVTSSIAEEGKTTTAICLARSAAIAGYKVVLVDCDLRRRASSRNLTNRLEAGLVEVLRGEAPLEKALIRDSASNAMLLPQREATGNDYDIIGSEAMRSLIGDLSSRFDLVILDSAPVLPVAETRAVAAMADATLLVVRWRKTPAVATKMALHQLAQNDVKVVGATLTKVDVRKKSGVGDEIYYYTAYAPAT